MYYQGLPLRNLFAGLGALLGCPWGGLGRSWGGLGGSWGALGGVLGGSWAVLGRHEEQFDFKIDVDIASRWS